MIEQPRNDTERLEETLHLIESIESCRASIRKVIHEMHMYHEYFPQSAAENLSESMHTLETYLGNLDNLRSLVFRGSEYLASGLSVPGNLKKKCDEAMEYCRREKT